MPDLKIKRLELRNWQTIKEADILFPEKGLVLILGKIDVDGEPIESVGAGKTAVGEAIGRVLFGYQGKHARLGDYVNDHESSMLVRITCTFCGKELIVENGYKWQGLSDTGEGFRYIYDGKTVERGRIAETQAELYKMIHTTPDLAPWCLFVDGDKINFTSLSEKDTVQLLMSALSQPSWRTFHEQTLKCQRECETTLREHKAVLKKSKSDIEAIESQIKTQEAAIIRLEHEFQTQESAWAANHATWKETIEADEEAIEGHESSMAELKKLLKQEEDKHAARSHELREAERSLQAKKSKHNADRATHQANVNSLTRDISSLHKAIKSFESSKSCPTCKRDYDAESVDEINQHISQHTEQIENIEVDLEQAKSDLVNVTSDIENINAQLKSITEELNAIAMDKTIQSLSTKYQQEETARNRLQKHLQSLVANEPKQPTSLAIASAKAKLETHVDSLEAAKAAVEASSKDIVDTESMLELVKYWTTAFSATGIPNMVIEDSIPALNDVALRISQTLTAGLATVSYATKRKLATGASRASVNIKVHNKLGSSKFAGSSKGESKLINLIVAETIAEVGNMAQKVGWRAYDEVLNSQDQRIRRALLSYMKQLVEQKDMLIFVVDHNPEVASFADKVLVAHKSEMSEAGVTRLYWA